MKKILLIFSAAFLMCAGNAYAQVSLVQDLYPGADDGLFQDDDFIEYNGMILFPGTDGTNGFELYAYQNGSITLVKEINAGSDGSDPYGFVAYDNKIYFIATDAASGVEIWVTDGTAGGTSLAIELMAGADPSGNGADILVPAKNGKLYFSFEGDAYVSDGTTAGTSMISGTTGYVSFTETYISQCVTTFGQGIAFYSLESASGDEEFKIYKHDGSTLTVMSTLTLSYVTEMFGLAEVTEGLLYATSDFNNTAFNGLYVIKNSDGSTVEILNASASIDVNCVLEFNSQKALFKITGGGIYATDGTQANTVKLTNASYTLYYGEQIPHAVFNDSIVFYGDLDFLDPKIYISNGTVAGTQLVATVTDPYLTNMIKGTNKAYWGTGFKNGFDPQIWETNIITKTSTKLFEFSQSPTTETSFLMGTDGQKILIATQLLDDGLELYTVTPTVTAVMGTTTASAYGICSMGGTSFSITSDNNEAIQIVQYDLNGRILNTINTETNTSFSLNTETTFSMLKVTGSKGVAVYKVME